LKVLLTIPGPPQGKARARVFQFHGRMIASTPKGTRLYEGVIRDIFSFEYPGFEPLTGGLSVVLRIYQPIPKAKAGLRNMELIERGELRPTTRPDADNVIKAALDALAGAAYRNDSQIVSLTADKYYSTRPRLEIEISEASPHA